MAGVIACQLPDKGKTANLHKKQGVIMPQRMILMIILLLSACTPERLPYRASLDQRPEGIYGFESIRFKMTRGEVIRTLHHRGYRPSVHPQAPTISYPTQLDAISMQVQVHFGKGQRVEKIELIADAQQITDEATCDALYGRIIHFYNQMYGAPSDIPASYRKQCKQQFRYDFADSSFIDVHYQWATHRRPSCYIQVFYNPSWATMCLVTNQRFCNFGQYHIPLE